MVSTFHNRTVRDVWRNYASPRLPLSVYVFSVLAQGRRGGERASERERERGRERESTSPLAAFSVPASLWNIFPVPQD